MTVAVLLTLLAQDDLSPEAGVVGRILGGVTIASLLGVVMWWLLFQHFPAQDRKDAEKAKIQADHIKYMFERHREALELERAASERRHGEFVKEIKDGQQAILALLQKLVESR